MIPEKTRILIVEDNPGDISLIRSYLAGGAEAGFDFEVTVASCLADAFEAFARSGYDLILLDLTLPDSEGVSTVRRVREAAFETPLIVLTGISDEDTGVSSVKAGAQDYIIKGQFDPKLLVRSIRYATERHRLVKELENSRRAEAQVSEGRLQAIQKLEQEIAEHRKTEQKLHVTTSELKAIFTVMPDLCFRMSGDGTIIDYKASSDADLYLSPDRFIGRRYDDIFPGELVATFSRAISEMRRTRSMTVIEYCLQMNGGEQCFEARLLPIFEDGTIFFVRNITDRKKALESIIASEKKYRDLADSLPQTIFEASMEGRLIFANRAAFEHFRYDENDFEKGLFVFQMIHPDDRERARQAFVAMAAGRPRSDLSREYTALRKNGERFSVSIHSSPIFENGKPVGIRGIIIDITDRKIAETQLATEKERLAVTLRSIGDGVIVTDASGAVTLLNNAAEELTGYVHYEAFGLPIEEIFNIVDVATRQKRPNPVRTVLSKKENAALADNTALISREGRERIISDSAAPIFDADCNVFGAVLVFRDITEKRRTEMELWDRENKYREQLEEKVAERTIELIRSNERLQREVAERQKTQEALREREERYRALAENTYDLICEVDTDGRFVYLSPNNRETLGYDIYEMVGRYYFDFIHPDDAAEFGDTFRKGFRNRRGEGIAYRFRHRDGSYILLESTGKIYQTASHQLRAVIVSRDVSIRRRMEEEMLRSSKLESVGILAGGIAHDFNNILMGIIGNITLAKKRVDAQDREKLTEVLLRAEKVAYKAKNLTEQLITFSKGGLPIKKIISLEEVIRDSAQFATAGSSVSCSFSIAPDLHPIEADEGQVSQVITNLIINAKQAMSQGGVIEVVGDNASIGENEIATLAPGLYSRISVRDSGVGIPSENLVKIFDPYFTTKPEGSGLGLSTSYSIVKNHGGLITVDSKPGEGSLFTVYFPSRDGRPDPSRSAEHATVHFTGRRVLLMDDDETVLIPVYEILTDLGYKVKTVKNGEAAIEIYKKHLEAGMPFDVVIMDLVIQNGAGGRETTEKLLLIDPNLCAVVSSGYSNAPVMADYRKYGFRGVLSKPYQGEEMHRLLQKLIGERNRAAAGK